MDDDIIEIKVFDFSHTLFFKGTAKINNKKELEQLNSDLKNKASISLNKKGNSGWFD